jgi:Glycosyl transferase family 2
VKHVAASRPGGDRPEPDAECRGGPGSSRHLGDPDDAASSALHARAGSRQRPAATLACVHPALILPARDEAESLGPLLARVPGSLGASVIVVDNGSADATASVARALGASVVTEPRRGYGWACQAGARRAEAMGCDVLVFLDADGTMAPEDVALLLSPIAAGRADLVLGARLLCPGAMPLHQRAANRVIATLLRRRRIAVSELGPFRAVRTGTWATLGMSGSRYAWPADMLVRAAAAGTRIAEVPVGYAPRRGGRSKVGGSVRGTVQATWDIGRTLLWRTAQ